MAEYATVLYAQASGAEAGSAPDEAYDRHADDIKQEGALVAAFALEPATTANPIRGDALTSDGPFAETKEFIAGFCVIEAPGMDAALAIARRNPILQEGGGVEVRPVAGSQVVPPGSEAGVAT